MSKREGFAAVLLIILIALSIWNVRRVQGITDEIDLSLCKSQSNAEKLNFKSAREYFSEALALWLSSEQYTHIFLSHGQINDTTQAFYQLQESIVQEDAASCAPSYDNLRYLLDSISKAEHPSLGSIF